MLLCCLIIVSFQFGSSSTNYSYQIPCQSRIFTPFNQLMLLDWKSKVKASPESSLTSSVSDENHLIMEAGSNISMSNLLCELSYREVQIPKLNPLTAHKYHIQYL